MRRRIKDSKEAGVYRNELLKEQKGLDPILGIKVTDPVLDHNHEGEQHCRATLQREVNSFEGKVFNSYRRFLRHLSDKELPEILRALADYYERDFDDKAIHHTALTVDTNKFKKLPSAEQCRILTVLGCVPESNTLKRSKQARKLIKEGKLNMGSLPK